MDSRIYEENESLNSQTDLKRYRVGNQLPMGTEQDTVTSSDPYMHIESGNANLLSESTGGQISQGPDATYLLPTNLEPRRQNRRYNMARSYSWNRDRDLSDHYESNRHCVSKCSFRFVAALAILALIGSVINGIMLFNLPSHVKDTSEPSSVAHLMSGDHLSRPYDGTEAFQRIGPWKEKENGAVEINLIEVPGPGLYYVYSQVGFLVRYDDKKSSILPSLSHIVYRHNVKLPNDGNDKLLTSILAQCSEKKYYGQYTSYVGAAVELEEGDRLYVNVSHMQDVIMNTSRTYLGFFKLN